MSREILLALAIGMCAAAAHAQDVGSYAIPCSQMPPAAAKAVPAPFDRYMRFECNRLTGQGLAPVKGFHWTNAVGVSIGLSSSRSGPPAPDGSRQFPLSWYTKLQPVDLSTGDQDRLRSDFRKGFRDEVLKDVQILELRAMTSNAEEKWIFLVLPKGKLEHSPLLLGLECNASCFHDDPEPMLFSGGPN